jgi:hypothetical protein
VLLLPLVLALRQQRRRRTLRRRRLPRLQHGPCPGAHQYGSNRRRRPTHRRARRRRWWRRVVLPVLRRWQLHAELWSTSSPPPLRSPSGDERHTAPGCGCGCGRGCGCATATATAAAIAMLHSDLPAPAPVAALATPPRRARGPPSAAPPRRCRSPPPCLSPPLPGRCHPRLLDKNRRGIGKSQSKRTAHTTVTPGSPPTPAAPPPLGRCGEPTVNSRSKPPSGVGGISRPASLSTPSSCTTLRQRTADGALRSAGASVIWGVDWVLQPVDWLTAPSLPLAPSARAGCTLRIGVEASPCSALSLTLAAPALPAGDSDAASLSSARAG